MTKTNFWALALGIALFVAHFAMLRSIDNLSSYEADGVEWETLPPAHARHRLAGGLAVGGAAVLITSFGALYRRRAEQSHENPN